jgi:hypothetical protein
MAHDVFISYSHKNKAIADAICAALENAGVRCWIAPRDIAPGLDWPTAISNAINESRLMVLVFSIDSNASKDVSRELILAANSNLIIIPFKIDAIDPEPGKQYYLARTHWLDAMNPPTRAQIDILVGYVRSFATAQAVSPARPSTAEVVPALPVITQVPPQPSGPEPGRRAKGVKRMGGWIAGAGLLLVALVAGIALALHPFGQTPLPDPPTGTPTLTLPPPTFTTTPTKANTPIPTVRPTVTVTPIPAWVNDFAQPLDARAHRPPSFQDDFGPGSAGWKAEDWCGAGMKIVQGEMVVTDCRLGRPGINYSDFMVEFDARFFTGAASDSQWVFGFRDLVGPSHQIRIYYNGDVLLSFYQGGDHDFPRAANPGLEANHILVIGKGSKFAIFLNDVPLFHTDAPQPTYGDFRFFADGTLLAIDNFKVWNIADLSVP